MIGSFTWKNSLLLRFANRYGCKPTHQNMVCLYGYKQRIRWENHQKFHNMMTDVF